MNTEQLRAEFEAWAKADGYEDFERFGEGYAHPELREAWRGYQAGRAALQSQDRGADPVEALKGLLPKLKETLEDLELFGLHSTQGYRRLREMSQKIQVATKAVDAVLTVQPAVNGYTCTVPDECETLHWRGQILSMNELASMAQPAGGREAFDAWWPMDQTWR